MWKNTVEPERPLMTFLHIVIICFVPKATDTYMKYLILIAFSQQHWLHELVSALRYTCIACLESSYISFQSLFFHFLVFSFSSLWVREVHSYWEVLGKI